MEEPFFFTNNKYKLFGVLHSPENKTDNNTGIILCTPSIDEAVWSYRVIVNFARILADNSYFVLRFDCMGQGDSEGEFQEVTIQTQVQDTLKAIAILQDKTNVSKIILIGTRLGGSVVQLTALQHKIDGMILWNPVVKGKTYFMDYLRSILTTQMATYGQSLYSRKDVIKDFEDGKIVNIRGYSISPEHYKEIIELNLLNSAEGINNPALIVQVSNKNNPKPEKSMTELYETLSKKNSYTRFETVKEELFWQISLTFYQRTQNLFNVTTNWLNNLVTV